MNADFITVNPYLGIDGIQPFLNDCKKYGKGIFALVKTSNPIGRRIPGFESLPQAAL